MLFRSFAHWLLIVFGLAACAASGLLAAKFGWLGEAAREWVLSILQPVQIFYAENKGDLHFAAKVIGTLGTMLGAAWTVHKGWHYAEANLPARLNEMNSRQRDGILHSRIDLIPALSQITTIAAPALTPPGLLERLWMRVHDREKKALSECEEELTRCKNEFGVLTTSRVRCRAEVVTAHLAMASRLARVEPSRGQDALDIFRKALSFNRTDLDALELSAKQAFAIGYRVQACRYLDDLADAAEGRDPIRHARALRFHAEILRGGERADRDAAREKLVAAIAALTGADAHDQGVRSCELGLAHEQLAAVQITRERFYAARAALLAAKQHFGRASLPCGPQGLHRLQELEVRLTRAEGDKDNPDVTD